MEEAARLVVEHKIGGMPVVEGDRLVGVLTMLDLISAFTTMLGLLRSSSRLDLSLEDKPEVLEAASELIKEAGGKIINVALGPSGARPAGLLFPAGEVRSQAPSWRAWSGKASKWWT